MAQTRRPLVYLRIEKEADSFGNFLANSSVNLLGGGDLSNVMWQTRYRQTWAWHSNSPLVEAKV
jgi:hypothetical protein